MTSLRVRTLLGIWMLATRCLFIPITLVSKHLHKRMGASADRFSERLGQRRQNRETDVIWFHAASLGEVMQIGPLADSLSRTEAATILVTTTTQAGAEWASREMPYAQHQFAPIDTPSAVTGFLDNWRPAVAIFVEGDLWPRLVTETQKRSVPQILLNARHSKTRERFSSIFSVLLAPFTLVTCRSQHVADGILALGLPADRVKVLPDLRVASPKLAVAPELTGSLSQLIGSRPVWLAASTHPDDEVAVLAAHGYVLTKYPDALLVIAPRHPKRGAPLQDMAQAQGFGVARRSLDEDLSSKTQVYVADTLGELGSFFSVAQLVFVGGSFGTEGGHNPYEPARFGNAIVSGSQVANFSDAYEALAQAGATVLVQNPAKLGETLTVLLGSEQIEQMGQSGLSFMDARENCVATYAELIAGVLHH